MIHCGSSDREMTILEMMIIIPGDVQILNVSITLGKWANERSSQLTCRAVRVPTKHGRNEAVHATRYSANINEPKAVNDFFLRSSPVRLFLCLWYPVVYSHTRTKSVCLCGRRL